MINFQQIVLYNKQKIKTVEYRMRATASNYNIIIILSLLTSLTLQCHHSCQFCNSELYTACTSCDNSLSPKIILQIDPYTIGLCSQNSNISVNFIGIFLLVFLIISCITFFNQEIFYFAFMLQSLGLFYFVQIYWISSLDIIFKSFSYLMVFINIQSSYKAIDQNLPIAVSYKSISLFKQAQTKEAISLVGIINLVLVSLMIIIPVFKAFRKKITTQRVHFLPDWILNKMMTVICTIYIMIIQQTLFAIYFSINYGKNSYGDYAIVFFYFLSLIFFVINQSFYPLSYFRNKIAQILLLCSKIIGPLFIVASTKNHFLIFIFLLIPYFWQMIITNQNKNSGKFNRLFAYKFYGLIVILVIMFYYIFQRAANSKQLSVILGIFTTIIVSVMIYGLVMEIAISIKMTYCKHQTSSQMENGNMQNTSQNVMEDNLKKIHVATTQFNLQSNSQDKIEKICRRETKNKSSLFNFDRLEPEKQNSNNFSLQVNQIDLTFLTPEDSLQMEVHPKEESLEFEIPLNQFCEAQNLEFNEHQIQEEKIKNSIQKDSDVGKSSNEFKTKGRVCRKKRND